MTTEQIITALKVELDLCPNPTPEQVAWWLECHGIVEMAE